VYLQMCVLAGVIAYWFSFVIVFSLSLSSFRCLRGIYLACLQSWFGWF
jgi:hypothetical protein